ncbi:DoxX family protein [Streptomyces sp. MAI_2237]
MFRFYRSTMSRMAALQGIALLILRAVTGWLFILHGLHKFTPTIAGFEGVLKPLGLPAPGLLSGLIAGFEIAAGALLIAGLLTRAVAVLLCAEMLVTGFWVKLSVWHLGVLGPNGAGGAEVDFIFLAVCLLIVAAGPAVLAADAVLGLERSSQDSDTDSRRDGTLAGSSAS